MERLAETNPDYLQVSNLVFDVLKTSREEYSFFSPHVTAETEVFIHDAVCDTLVLTDEELMERAKEFDSKIPEEDQLAIGEQQFADSLTNRFECNYDIQILNGASHEQAVAQAGLQLRADVAMRIFRLAYLSRFPTDQIIKYLWNCPELVQATRLTDSVAQATWRKIINPEPQTSIAYPDLP